MFLFITTQEATESAARTYMDLCASCHGGNADLRSEMHLTWTWKQDPSPAESCIFSYLLLFFFFFGSVWGCFWREEGTLAKRNHFSFVHLFKWGQPEQGFGTGWWNYLWPACGERRWLCEDPVFDLLKSEWRVTVPLVELWMSFLLIRRNTCFESFCCIYINAITLGRRF